MKKRGAARAHGTAAEAPLGWMLHLLHHLGWANAATLKPKPLGTGRGVWDRAHAITLALPEGAPLLIVEAPAPLAGKRIAFEAFEDLTNDLLALRAAMDRAGVQARHAIAVEPRGTAQLVDFAQEELLLETGDRNETAERIMPLLEAGALVRGSLATYPRKGPAQRAAELARWTHLWTTRLGASLELPREPIERFFRSLLLVRVAEALGQSPADAPPLASVVAAPERALRTLATHLKPLVEKHRFIQEERTAAPLLGVAKRADERDGLLAECLGSFARCARSKFSADLFADAFADAELRQLSWRNSLLEESPAAADAPTPRWLLETCPFDLDAGGFVLLLRQFDRVVEDLRRLRQEESARARRGELSGVQMDVFGREPSAPPEDDAALFALGDVLRVTTTQRPRAELARMVLLAHTAAWNVRLRREDAVMPPAPVRLLEPPPAPAAPTASPPPAAAKRAYGPAELN